MNSDKFVSVFLCAVGIGLSAWGFISVLQSPEFSAWLILASGACCFMFGVLIFTAPVGTSAEADRREARSPAVNRAGLIVGVSAALCAALVFAGISVSKGANRSTPNIMSAEERAEVLSAKEYYFVLNTDTKVFHNPWCSAVEKLSDKNFGETNLSPEDLIEIGYAQCGLHGDFDVDGEPTPPAAEAGEAEEYISDEPELVVVAIAGTDESLSLPSGTLVWLPANGKKFHSVNDCRNMNPDKATQTTVDAASADGYEACENCW